MRICQSIALLLLPLALAGCSIVPGITKAVQAPFNAIKGGFSKENSESGTSAKKTPAKEETVVGTIRFSYEGFALIYTPTNTKIPAGTKASTVGKDGKRHDVELRICEERKGPFLVADIIKGTPAAGQLVVTRHEVASAEEERQVLE